MTPMKTLSPQKTSTQWSMLLLLAGLGLVFVNSKQGRQVVEDAANSLQHGLQWVGRVIRRVTSHEGDYDSLNLNSDGAGLSMGILQWSQRTGMLGTLLNEFYAAEPSTFRQIFGPSAAQLIMHTKSGSLAPLDGALLWATPWKERFRQAGQHQPWQLVQDRLASVGPHMTAARQIAATLGVKTERALALYFDRAVQQGQSGAPAIAAKVAADLRNEARPSDRAILERFAAACANRFRSLQAPNSTKFSAHLTWRKVGQEWHVFAGNIDLYVDILRRTNGILNDKSLSDAPITLS